MVGKTCERIGPFGARSPVIIRNPDSADQAFVRSLQSEIKHGSHSCSPRSTTQLIQTFVKGSEIHDASHALRKDKRNPGGLYGNKIEAHLLLDGGDLGTTLGTSHGLDLGVDEAVMSV